MTTPDAPPLDAASPAAGGRPRRSTGAARAAATTLLLIVSGGLACRLGALRNEWNSDIGGWMLISRLMNEGLRPYVDMWDNKLPPIYWIGQFYWATGRPHWAMYLTDAALTVAAALGMAATLRLAGLRGAVALAFGGAAVATSMPFWFPHSNNVYAAAPFSLGIALVCLGVGRRSRWQVAATCWAGGLLVGLAAALSGLLAAPAIEGAILATAAVRARGGRSAALGGYVLGGLTAAGMVLGLAAAGGYLRPMLDEAVLGAGSYAAGVGTGAYRSPGKVLYDFRDNVARGVVGWLAALLGALAVAGRRRRLDPLPRAVATFAVAWFATQVATTFISGYQFLHYHYLVGWSAGLLAGAGWLALAMPRRRPDGLVPGALAALLALGCVSSVQVFNAYLGLAKATRGTKATRLEALIRARVPADETILLVDDYVESVGMMARLPNRPGSRHVLASMYEFVPVERAERAFFARLGRRFLDDLGRNPPDWLVRAEGRDDLLTPEVRRLYDEVDRNGEYVLYRRARPAARPTAPGP
ncbi:MAG TPA: hypothetical protein VG406_14455 [Isosphaeraceae bacterium]|nr:hypothetical protein [Isosphaeraceae bacterium]